MLTDENIIKNYRQTHKMAYMLFTNFFDKICSYNIFTKQINHSKILVEIQQFRHEMIVKNDFHTQKNVIKLKGVLLLAVTSDILIY